MVSSYKAKKVKQVIAKDVNGLKREKKQVSRSLRKVTSIYFYVYRDWLTGLAYVSLTSASLL